MKNKVDPRTKLNLGEVNILVLESGQHALDILVQILTGFGVREIYRCLTVEEAEKVVARKQVDLLIMDPVLREGDGFGFLRKLRHSRVEPNCYVPAIMIHGHMRHSDVAKMRDTGANFVVAKPITPHVLLQRILWTAADKRPFVDIGAYLGPDRRFKFEGPPPGSDGRRADDLSAPLGEVVEPNLSQGEIAQMIKPQRVSL